MKITCSRLGIASWCPGSLRLIDQVPKVTSPAMERGTLMHEAIAEDTIWQLEGKDKEAAEWAQETLKRMIDEHAPGATIEPEVLMEHELEDGTIIRGKADYIAVSREHPVAVIAEIKTGVGTRGITLQLIAYAWLLTKKHPVSTVYAITVKPDARKAEQFLVEDRHYAILEETIRRCSDPDAPLIPGSHCAICPAAGRCRASLAHMLRLTDPLIDPALLPTDRIVAILQAIQAAYKIVEPLRAELVKRGDEAVRPYGVHIVTRKETHVTDPSAALHWLVERIGPKAYEAVSLSYAKAVELVAESTGISTKEADTVLRNALPLEEKHTKPYPRILQRHVSGNILE